MVTVLERLRGLYRRLSGVEACEQAEAEVRATNERMSRVSTNDARAWAKRIAGDDRYFVLGDAAPPVSAIPAFAGSSWFDQFPSLSTHQGTCFALGQEGEPVPQSVLVATTMDGFGYYARLNDGEIVERNPYGSVSSFAPSIFHAIVCLGMEDADEMPQWPAEE